MSRLDEAFAMAQEVHHNDVFDDARFSFNYLTLECLGCYASEPDGATWAASFDALLGEEWYEKDEIRKFATATRAATPEDAILGAAKKFYQFVSEQTA